MISSGPGTGGRLSRRVYDGIKERLLGGEFAGGESLSVEQLRGDFGVSKQPVMEALRLLAADGMVEILPQVGSVVASYSTAEAVDFYKMFARFEGAITEVAAERADPMSLIRLRAFADGMHGLESQQDSATRAQSYRPGTGSFMV